MKRIPFCKMHGTGNDFVLVEKKDLGGIKAEDFAVVASKRHLGAGSDGLLVVEDSAGADIRMRMYNPDGSEAMCGNGIRCFAKYVYEKGLVAQDTMHVETIAGVKELKLTVCDGAVESVLVDMGEPIFERAQIPVAEHQGGIPILEHKLSVLDKAFTAAILSMGNPHCVIFIDELAKDDVIRYGKVIESHEFFPERVNVEFVKVISRDHIEMNVYERGAGFTLSCGTGTCASAVAAHLKGYTNDQVKVTVPGGELRVEYEQGGHVFMAGPAALVYEGIYYYKD